MDLLALTRRRHFCLDLRSSEKTAVLEELLDFLLATGEVPKEARPQLLAAILAREERLSTGMEGGVALPHGLTDAIGEEVAVVGISGKGVPFEALDGQPARIIVLLLTPRSKVFRHVTNVREIARVLRHGETRERILLASQPEEIVEVLEDAYREGDRRDEERRSGRQARVDDGEKGPSGTPVP